MSGSVQVVVSAMSAIQLFCHLAIHLAPSLAGGVRLLLMTPSSYVSPTLPMSPIRLFIHRATHSPNSLATLKVSYGRCEGPVFNRCGIGRVRDFPCKFLHKMVPVKYPYASRLRKLAQNGVLGHRVHIFLVNFHTKWFL